MVELLSSMAAGRSRTMDHPVDGLLVSPQPEAGEEHVHFFIHHSVPEIVDPSLTERFRGLVRYTMGMSKLRGLTERGLRALLRHFRSLMGRTPEYILRMQSQAASATSRASSEAEARRNVEAEAAMLTYELEKERTKLAKERASWAAERHAFEQERAHWAVVIRRLHQEIDRRAANASALEQALATEELAAGASWALAARDWADTQAARDLHAREAAERERLAGELSWTRWQLAERERQLHELACRSQGAHWLARAPMAST